MRTTTTVTSLLLFVVAAGGWGADGGRIYSTALMLLTLEASYRHSVLVK